MSKNTGERAAELQEFGYTIVEDAISLDQMVRFRSTIDRLERGQGRGGHLI